MASASPPRRRFLPDPIDISSRTSKRRYRSGSDTSPPPSDSSDSTTESSVEALRVKQYLSQEHSATNDYSPADDTANGLDNKMKLTSIETTDKPGRVAFDDAPVHPGHATSRPVAVRRKFAPEPVETTTRASKIQRQPEQDPSTVKPKRRFAPDPVETSARSTKSTKTNESEQNEDQRPRRKFAPEPVETTAKSSKDKDKKADEESSGRSKRKFAPQPVETSTRSSKEKEGDDGEAVKPKPKRKFLPQPVETSTERRRKPEEEEPTERKTSTPSRSSSGNRKFSPELIETAKGSYRKQPAPPPAPRLIRPDGEEEPPWEAPEPEESRFSAASLAKKSYCAARSHSYMVPHLPMIESDSSDDESDCLRARSRTRSTSRSPVKTPDSEHSNYTEFVFRLANKADEQKLREQVLAAYINEEDHIPVSHFAAEDDEDDTASIGKFSVERGADPQLFRRMSHADLPLVMQDMRRHHEQLERAKRDWQEDTAGASRFSAAALAARHHLGIHHPPAAGHEDDSTLEGKVQTGQDEDAEFAKMRAAASPPMQGTDLKFPFTISPKMTRCDVDQAPRPRRANSEDDEDYDIGNENLWSAHVQIKKESSLGLWGGLCQKGSQEPTRPPTPIRSGIQTPACETVNPFESHTPGRGTRTPGRRQQGLWGMGLAPLTPVRTNESDSFINAVDQKLNQKLLLEAQITEEFPNKVITQIYNYLSLGYPPLARPFDEELSKISKISIAELRRDDRTDSGNVMGYIGSPEGEGNGEEDDNGAVRSCRRWEALKMYVHEWARQSPNFTGDNGVPYNRGVSHNGWGANAPVRKGSWGN